eukprot:TRINITY_DN370_c0_g1_i1.p3 TRINITY_DN370_c0_g1~~TRINITY_DN370_c0_g1_i1.p3  ORF type:complete len:146 (+),score=58.90 TRINITY_DN370_c0_g1_i1:46-438(+)
MSLSRVFTSRSLSACRSALSTRSAGDVARSKGAYQERERAEEKRFAMERDREAIEKLRQKLMAEEQRAVEEHGPEALPDTPAPSTFGGNLASSDNITMEEFLDFRKEMISKVRELEDELHTVKFQLKKKK